MPRDINENMIRAPKLTRRHWDKAALRAADWARRTGRTDVELGDLLDAIGYLEYLDGRA